MGEEEKNCALGLLYNRDNRAIVTLKVINPVIQKAFKSPNYLGVQLWDLLPRETQVEPAFTTFKFKVKG